MFGLEPRHVAVFGPFVALFVIMWVGFIVAHVRHNLEN